LIVLGKFYLSVNISSYEPNFFFYSIYISLTYKCEKCELFGCFANAISLRLKQNSIRMIQKLYTFI